MSFTSIHSSARFQKFSVALVLAISCLFAGCQQTAARQQPATGSARPPLVMSAQNIVLEERYPAPGAEPGEERNFPQTPAGAVRDWVKTRLHTDGAPGAIKIILLDARVTRKDLKVQKGLKGMFSDDQKYRYDGRIYLRVEYTPATPEHPSSYAEAEASGFFTVPEGASVNQLEGQAAALVRDLMQRTELELENNMLRYMPGVLR